MIEDSGEWLVASGEQEIGKERKRN